MSAHAVAVAILLGAGVLLTIVCSLGVLSMRDPMQKLHYIAPPSTLSAALLTIALFVDEKQKQAGTKAIVVTLLLVVMNAVVTHATARAARVRELGRMEPRPEDRIPIVGEDGFAGESGGNGGGHGPGAGR